MTDERSGDTIVSDAPNSPNAGSLHGPATTVTLVDPEDFYKKEFKQLVRYVLYCAGSTDTYDACDAHDAVQDAFALALPRWETIRYPRAWLRKVALREFLRSDVLDLTGSFPETGADDTTHAIEQRRQEALVRTTMNSLPFKQRQALALAYDGFTPAEIAAQLDQDPTAVRQNLHKARRNLRKHPGTPIAESRTNQRTKDAS